MIIIIIIIIIIITPNGSPLKMRALISFPFSPFSETDQNWTRHVEGHGKTKSGM
jgi:hypothetical protein